jgi:hypothetical protein
VNPAGSLPRDDADRDRSDPSPPAAASDAVEEALAKAITAAVDAGRFDVVAQLARDLEARRVARAGNVIAFADKRAKRGGA